MKNIYKLSLILTVAFTVLNANAQYTSKKIRDVHEAYTDSLKNVEYNYFFPILGQGAYSEGFDIPYPFGIMANYFWSEQGITVNNLQLGYKNAYNDGNSFDLRPILDDDGKEILGFGDNKNIAYSYNVRPDLWVFPFLDIYGIFGYGKSHTEVNINRLGSQEFNLQSVVDQGIKTGGVGILAAGGIGPVWVSGDFNFTWNKPELTTNTTLVKVMGLRMGHVMKFKKRPDKNISVWIGAMRVKMEAETLGEISIKEAFPQEVWDNKAQTVADYRDWYNNEATPGQKLVADKVLTPIIDELDKRDGKSIMQYGIDKKAVQEWNMLLGAQYQFNKHWQLRFEAGIVGDRKSFLASLNYRFLWLKRKSS